MIPGQFYHVRAKQLAWRGVGHGTLNDKNSQKNMQLVDNAVANMCKKYRRSAMPVALTLSEIVILTIMNLALGAQYAYGLGLAPRLVR